MTSSVARRLDIRVGSTLVLFALVALAALFVAGVMLLVRVINEDTLPDRVGAIVLPPGSGIRRYDLKEVDGARLRVVDEDGAEQELLLKADAMITLLEPAPHTALRPGDWLTVVVVPNVVKNFAIRALVAVPASFGTGPVDGFVRLPGGFSGYEAGRDSAERPLIGGVVREVVAREARLDGAAGPITVVFEPDAPLRRAAIGSLDGLRPGDRLAVLPDGSAVLVQR